MTSLKKLKIQNWVKTFSPTPLALSVLLLGLSLTGLAWKYTSKTIAQETRSLLDEQINEATEALNNRINVYLDTFYAARGFWIANNLAVPYHQWKLFVASLDLQKRYPGINGLGFIRYVPDNLENYENQIRQNNSALEPIYKNYTVFPLNDKHPRPDYFVIEYSEPILANREAIGLDVGHEPVRRKGAERAIETGKPAATGEIILVQDAAKTPGLLIYLPIYRPGMPLDTVAQRRRAFFGFIYAPFRVLDLVEEGLPQSIQQNFDLVIYNNDDLMYGQAKSRPQGLSPSNARYYQEISLDVAGETWDLYFTSNSNLRISGENLPKIVLAVGLLSSLLLFGIICSLATSYRHIKVAKETADAANRAKSAFLASMSHELRTPLNAILGFTQIMSRNSSIQAEQLENLGIISRSGEHLLSLINDVLDMSKIEAGRTTLNQTSFDLYELLDILEEMLLLRAESKNLQLKIKRTPDVPQYIKADAGKLRQILINLLGNAIKFTEHGTVTLRVHSQSVENSHHSLQFEVEDTGPGIAPEELDALFDPFVQTETGRKSQEGTGLGLPISQKFLELMGGDISVDSRLGKGTIFRFHIPIELAQAADIPTSQPIQRVIGLASNQPTYRILVVDDRWENRQVLMKLLKAVGFQVNEAANGEEAIRLWEEWNPHLIWMDMRMPVMNGYEATQKIKATTKGQATAIIALTASAFEEERAMVLSYGCDDFVRKPFQEAVIFEKMAEQLGVQYIYQEPEVKSIEPVVSQTETIEIEELLAEQMAQMPREWVERLKQAAIELNAKHTLILIQQIPREQAALTNILTDWVNDFRFDNITDLIEAMTT